MTRRRSLLCLAAVSAIPLLGCDGSPTKPNVVLVRGGTSFGFCLPTAYCQTTLQVTPGSAVLTKTSRALGDIRIEGPVAEAEWASLVAAVDEKALRALPDAIGCPGCRDEGAEWVEVATDGWTKRVTFSRNESVPSIQPLVDHVRRIRQRLDPPRAIPGAPS